MFQQTAPPAAPTTQTTRLLACGIVAGPLFLAVGLIQAFTREGFDLSRHPLSLLSLGQRRWVGACVATAVAVLVLTSWPDLDSLSVRLVLATAIQFGFVAAMAARLPRALPDPAATSAAAY